MKRTLNFTGKRKIPENDIVLDAKEQAAKTVVTYTIDRERLEGEGKLVLQANYRGEFHRFEREDIWSDTEIPGKIHGAFDLEHLSDLDVSEPLTFNVYIVEGNRIKRYCEEVSISRGEDQETILPVRPGDTGRRFWEIQYERVQDGPTLVLNRQLDRASSKNIKNEATSPDFIFKVYPAIIRDILSKIIFDLNVSSKDTSITWAEKWLIFAEHYSEEIPELDPDSRDIARISDWIDEVVRNFLASQTNEWISLVRSREG